MDQGPLVKEEIDAGEGLVLAFDRYKHVKAAFWLKIGGEDLRYLHLSSDQLDDSKIREAYGEVHRLVSLMHSPYLDPFRVKVITGDDPLALAAEEILREPNQPWARRFGGTMFGGVYADDVYLYPTRVSMSCVMT
jgi:hypothetical protein